MRPTNDFIRKPTGPLMGLWSWKYLNFWKTIKLVNSNRVKEFYGRFPSIFPPGNKFPNFELKDLEGASHRVSNYFGKKNLVVTTGAIT